MIRVPGYNTDDNSFYNYCEYHNGDGALSVMIIPAEQKRTQRDRQQDRRKQTNTPHTIITSNFNNHFISFAEFFSAISFNRLFLLPRPIVIQNTTWCIFNNGGFYNSGREYE